MKILDHTKPLSGIKTRLHKKILWPCYEYNLVIKGRVNLEDNILESLILQLMEANVRDLDQLSSMTGLERDLIIFLRERLHHKGYLDDLMHITEFGLKKINKRSVPEQYYCSIFVDAISGKLLPKIIPLEEQKEIVFESAHELSPEETNDTISYFSYKEPSSVGYEDIESKLLPLFSPQKDKNREPSSDDIRDLIKKVFTGKECNYITFNLACDYKLTYLTVDLVLQEGNKFLWITTDGFGDISPFFSENLRYLNQNEEKYIQGLRKKLSNKIIRDAGFDSKNNCSSGKEDKDWIKYPEIGNKLQKLQGLLKKLDKLGESSDEQRILHEAKITSIENIYQIIEWILYYYIKQNELYAKKQIEEIQNLSDKPVKHTAVGTYVVRIARDLGFQISKEQEKLFRTKLGTMKFSMKAGENHELFSLLNLTIAINKDVQESPVRKLAVEFPTLLAFLGELKEARGKAAHSHETNISATKILEYFTNLEKIINILFKKKISEANTPNKKLHRFELVQEENIENEIISLLEEKYGYGVLYVLPSDYIQILVEMEKGCIDKKNIMPVVILNEYKLLEKIFHYLQLKTKTIKINFDYFQYAQNKALAAGFKFDEKTLPVLAKTNKERIELALNYKDISLQAVFLAWLCSEREDNLKKMSCKCSDLPCMINRIAQLRGHGELPEKSDYQNSEIVEFSNKIKEIITYLACDGYFSSQDINHNFR